MILVLSLELAATGEMIDQLKDALERAVVETALREHGLRGKEMVEGSSDDKGRLKKKRMLRRRIVNQNDNSNVVKAELIPSDSMSHVSPLSLLLKHMADKNRNEKSQESSNPHRQTLILRRPFGLGDINPFNDQDDDPNDISEENPMVMIRAIPIPMPETDSESQGSNLLQAFLDGSSQDQPERRQIRRRIVRRRRVQKRKIVTPISPPELSNPEENDKFDNILTDILRTSIAEAARNPSDAPDNYDDDKDTFSGDDKSPTIIFLKGDEQPNPSLFNDDSDEDKNATALQKSDSGSSSILGDMISGILGGVLAGNDQHSDSDNGDSFSSEKQSSTESLPLQIIGGLLSGLFKGLSGKDISEENSENQTVMPAQTTVHRIRKIHRIRHTKRTTVRKSSSRPNYSFADQNDSLLDFPVRYRPNLPILSDKSAETPNFSLLGGMYTGGRSAGRGNYPSIRHDGYSKPFRPLNLSDYINSPATSPTPVIRKQIVRRRQIRKRAVHRKRIMTRSAGGRDISPIGDLVNSLLAALPQINNSTRV